MHQNIHIKKSPLTGAAKSPWNLVRGIIGNIEDDF